MSNETITTTEALTLFAEIFEYPVEQLTLSTKQSEIAGWDSMGVLSLMAEFDSRFGITLSSDQLDSLTCIGDLFNVLKENKKLAE